MNAKMDDAARVASQYQNANGLRARMRLHAKYTVEDEPFYAFIRRQIALSAGENLLECGAGDGALWMGAEFPEGARLTLTDLSDGMAGELRARFSGDARVRVMTADVQNLPFEDGSFQVTVADHMLYHVPDMEGAIRELARVLAPGGRLIASTMGEDNFSQLWRMANAQAPRLKFTLENGAIALSRFFSRVEVREHPAYLRITDSGDAADYMESAITLGAQTRASRAEICEAIDRAIQKYGYFRVDKRAGVFICFKGE